MMRTQNHHLNHHNHHDDDEQSRVLYELSSLVLSLIRSPNSPISSLSDRHLNNTNRSQQISPSGFASLLLGISFALMLCGSVTFFIGCILMPWVVGFLMLFYFVGMLSYISMLGRAIFYQATSPLSPPKEIPFVNICQQKRCGYCRIFNGRAGGW